MGRIAPQHDAQTGPRVGAASGRSHAAHTGASSTASAASASVDTPALEPYPFDTASSVTSRRSASPHKRSSE